MGISPSEIIQKPSHQEITRLNMFEEKSPKICEVNEVLSFERQNSSSWYFLTYKIKKYCYISLYFCLSFLDSEKNGNVPSKSPTRSSFDENNINSSPVMKNKLSPDKNDILKVSGVLFYSFILFWFIFLIIYNYKMCDFRLI